MFLLSALRRSPLSIPLPFQPLRHTLQYQQAFSYVLRIVKRCTFTALGSAAVSLLWFNVMLPSSGQHSQSSSINIVLYPRQLKVRHSEKFISPLFSNSDMSPACRWTHKGHWYLFTDSFPKPGDTCETASWLSCGICHCQTSDSSWSSVAHQCTDTTENKKKWLGYSLEKPKARNTKLQVKWAAC